MVNYYETVEVEEEVMVTSGYIPVAETLIEKYPNGKSKIRKRILRYTGKIINFIP